MDSQTSQTRDDWSVWKPLVHKLRIGRLSAMGCPATAMIWGYLQQIFVFLDTFQAQLLILSGLTWQPGGCSPTNWWRRVFFYHSSKFALGVSLGDCRFPNITVICIGKSTMARCGIIANITEASWEATWPWNSAMPLVDCRIYANEGVLQLLF